jgi:hypothetical protein
MHHHRHCGSGWPILLAVLLLMDSARWGMEKPSSESNSGSGCAGCLGVLVVLALVLVGLVAAVRSAHPDPPVPAVSYAQVEATPDYAPRAQLIALPVRRAELVRLPRPRSDDHSP